MPADVAAQTTVTERPSQASGAPGTHSRPTLLSGIDIYRTNRRLDRAERAR